MKVYVVMSAGDRSEGGNIALGVYASKELAERSKPAPEYVTEKLSSFSRETVQVETNPCWVEEFDLIDELGCRQ